MNLAEDVFANQPTIVGSRVRLELEGSSWHDRMLMGVLASDPRPR